MKNLKNIKILLALASISFPVVSEARSIESIINHTVTYLQGGLARSIGILCIIVMGYLCLALQKFPKESFIMVLIGMGIIFGGSTLYSILIA
jgi:type IV secretion system protein VirB2